MVYHHLNVDDLNETTENQEGGAEKNMKEDDLETNVRGNVKNRVRNRKDIDSYGPTFIFQVGPDRHIIFIFMIE